MQVFEFGMQLSVVRPVDVVQAGYSRQSWTWISAERMEVEIVDDPS